VEKIYTFYDYLIERFPRSRVEEVCRSLVKFNRWFLPRYLYPQLNRGIHYLNRQLMRGVSLQYLENTPLFNLINTYGGVLGSELLREGAVEYFLYNPFLYLKDRFNQAAENRYARTLYELWHRTLTLFYNLYGISGLDLALYYTGQMLPKVFSTSWKLAETKAGKRLLQHVDYSTGQAILAGMYYIYISPRGPYHLIKRGLKTFRQSLQEMESQAAWRALQH